VVVAAVAKPTAMIKKNVIHMCIQMHAGKDTIIIILMTINAAMTIRTMGTHTMSISMNMRAGAVEEPTIIMIIRSDM